MWRQISMANKFQRRFILRLQTYDNQTLQIENPLTCEFNITRQNLVSCNTANFTIYNLSEKTRNRIFHDLYDLENFKAIEFWAGYGYGETNSFLARCFYGGIKQAYSVRDGANFKTLIEAADGLVAAATGFISQTVGTEQSFKDILLQTMNTMPTINNATVGDGFDDKPIRPVTLFGNQFEILNLLSRNTFYVDSQDAYILNNKESLEGFINRIDDNMGLLDTPQKSQTMIDLSVLFEPRLVPSQYIELNSKTLPLYNGKYKIVALNHTGIISDAIGGDARTKVTLLNLEVNKIIKTNITNYFKGP